MSTHVHDEEEQIVSLLSLSDDVLIQWLTFLEFGDIANSVSKLNRRFNELSLNPNALFSVRNYPMHQTWKSIKHLAMYIHRLIQNEDISSFVYRIKKVDWINASSWCCDDDAFVALFERLKHLKHLQFGGAEFHFLQNLPLQSHLTHLILQCNDQYVWDDEPEPTFTISQFLGTKIDCLSIHLLKEFTVSDMMMNVQSLQVLSKMINLEIFKFEGVQFDDVDAKLIQNTFAKWKHLEILDIYTQTDADSQTYSTFEDDQLNDVMLRALLSLKTLKNVTFSFNPWNAYIQEDHDHNEPFASRIRRIFPCFRNVSQLEHLEFYIFDGDHCNSLLMVEILKIIDAETNKKLKSMTINANAARTRRLDINKFKQVVFQALSMTELCFKIKLPPKKKWFMIFADMIAECNTTQQINCKQLVVSNGCCKADLWKYVVDNCRKLSEILHGMCQCVRIEFTGGNFAKQPSDRWYIRIDGTKWDGFYSGDDHDELDWIHPDWIQLENQLKEVGFRLRCSAGVVGPVYAESIIKPETRTA